MRGRGEKGVLMSAEMQRAARSPDSTARDNPWVTPGTAGAERQPEVATPPLELRPEVGSLTGSDGFMLPSYGSCGVAADAGLSDCTATVAITRTGITGETLGAFVVEPGFTYAARRSAHATRKDLD